MLESRWAPARASPTTSRWRGPFLAARSTCNCVISSDLAVSQGVAFAAAPQRRMHDSSLGSGIAVDPAGPRLERCAQQAAGIPCLPVDPHAPDFPPLLPH